MLEFIYTHYISVAADNDEFVGLILLQSVPKTHVSPNRRVNLGKDYHLKPLGEVCWETGMTQEQSVTPQLLVNCKGEKITFMMERFPRVRLLP